jgi:hypothetical protein
MEVDNGAPLSLGRDDEKSDDERQTLHDDYNRTKMYTNGQAHR